MGQLRMVRDTSPINIPTLPEGFSIRPYHDGDWKGWVEACAEGLNTGSWSEQDFHDKMLAMEGLEPEGIIFVVDSNGRIAGTATGWMKPEHGYVHMVGMHTDYRGKGLAKALNAAAVHYLLEKGCSEIYLDTDDFRVPAIKVYLALDFLPVLYEEDMVGRWLEVLKMLGRKECAALTKDGEKTLLISVKD